MFGRNKTFWPKLVFRPKFRFGQNFGFLRGIIFGFGLSAKKLFRLPTTSEYKTLDYREEEGMDMGEIGPLLAHEVQSESGPKVA